MNASETQRVADVMSMSFNKSALDLQSFSEAIGLYCIPSRPILDRKD